jgi:hypothetical protein
VTRDIHNTVPYTNERLIPDVMPDLVPWVYPLGICATYYITYPIPANDPSTPAVPPMAKAVARACGAGSDPVTLPCVTCRRRLTLGPSVGREQPHAAREVNGVDNRGSIRIHSQRVREDFRNSYSVHQCWQTIPYAIQGFLRVEMRIPSYDTWGMPLRHESDTAEHGTVTYHYYLPTFPNTYPG